VRNEEVEQVTVRLMQALGYRGILDIGYRFDARDGTYKLLDANPRLGVTFRLFVDSVGVDVARALYLDLTGQAFEAGEPVPGRRWAVENLDVASAIRHVRSRELSVAGWVRSLRAVDEWAWFARDDVRPFLRMCGSFAGACVHRVLGRGRTRRPAAAAPAQVEVARARL
jgi:D-aspartate ligase